MRWREVFMNRDRKASHTTLSLSSPYVVNQAEVVSDRHSDCIFKSVFFREDSYSSSTRYITAHEKLTTTFSLLKSIAWYRSRQRNKTFGRRAARFAENLVGRRQNHELPSQACGFHPFLVAIPLHYAQHQTSQETIAYENIQNEATIIEKSNRHPVRRVACRAHDRTASKTSTRWWRAVCAFNTIRVRSTLRREWRRNRNVTLREGVSGFPLPFFPRRGPTWHKYKIMMVKQKNSQINRKQLTYFFVWQCFTSLTCHLGGKCSNIESQSKPGSNEFVLCDPREQRWLEK